MKKMQTISVYTKLSDKMYEDAQENLLPPDKLNFPAITQNEVKTIGQMQEYTFCPDSSTKQIIRSVQKPEIYGSLIVLNYPVKENFFCNAKEIYFWDAKEQKLRKLLEAHDVTQKEGEKGDILLIVQTYEREKSAVTPWGAVLPLKKSENILAALVTDERIELVVSCRKKAYLLRSCVGQTVWERGFETDNFLPEDEWKYDKESYTSPCCMWINLSAGEVFSHDKKMISCEERLSYCTDEGIALNHGSLLLLRTRKKAFLLNTESNVQSEWFDKIEAVTTRYGKVYLVQKNNRYGLIVPDEEKYLPNCVIPVEYDEILYVSGNDTFILEKNGKYGRAAADGTILVHPIWTGMSRLDVNCPEYIQVKNGRKYGAILPSGKNTIPAVWDTVLFGLRPDILFHANLKENCQEVAAFRLQTGEQVFGGTFKSVEHTVKSDRYIIVVTCEGLTGLYDLKEQKYAVKPCVCSIESEEGLITVTADDGCQNFES